MSTRLLPTQNVPGPVTAIAELQPGETGLDALDRIGKAVLPPQTGRARPAKLPRQLAAVIALRTEGMTDREMAAALNLSVLTIRKILQKARRDHGMDDLVDRVKNRAVHTAVDNLIEKLDEGDAKFTKYVLGNTIFKKGEKQQGSASVSNELRVVIEMPNVPEGAPAVAIGAIVGTPQSKRIAAAPEVETVDAVS